MEETRAARGTPARCFFSCALYGTIFAPAFGRNGKNCRRGGCKGGERMNVVLSGLQTFFSIMKTFTVWDAVDILLVAYLIYKAIELVSETRAEQLLKGILLLVILYNLAIWLNLKAMSYLLVTVVQFGFVALVVLFQPELRSVLEHIGSAEMVTRLRFFGGGGVSDTGARDAIDAICGAAAMLQKNRIGALILFERSTRLGEIAKTGTIVNADISPELVENVFYPKSPLHDGAMIIRGGRVFAAGCFLPLSQNQEVSRELGTRHRAALGISESSDVLVVVVSEETGVISLVERGVIKRSLTPDTLRIALEKGLGQNARQKKNGFASGRRVVHK